MSKNKIHKAAIVKSINKMVSDKETVRSYIKGNTDLKTIQKEGIKFARPI